MINIYRKFLEQVNLNPTKVALVEGECKKSYSEVNERIKQIAYYLWENDIRKNDKVAVYMENSIDMVCILFAMAMLGAIAVPVNRKIAPNRIRDIYYDYDIVGILCAEKCDELIGCNVLDISQIGNEVLEEVTDNNDLVCIFTSSSTGESKGCLLNQVGIWNTIQGKIEVLQLNASDVFVLSMSTGFVAALWQIFTPLILGCSLHILSSKEYSNPYLLFKKADKCGATVLAVVPSMLKLYCECIKGPREPLQLTSLKALVSTGQILPASTVKDFYAIYNIPLVNAYGQSECSDDTFHYKIPFDFVGEYVPIGYPVNNFEVRIEKNNDMENRGELLIAGVGVIDGYVNENTRNHNKFLEVDGNKYFRTGDNVGLNSRGEYIFYGRIDNMIKINGYKVFLEEIERAMLKVEGVEEVAVLVVEKDPITSLVAMYRGESFNKEKLRAQLKKDLADYMLPHEYVCMNELPYNLSGKIDRKKLREILDAKLDYSNIKNDGIVQGNDISEIMKEVIEKNSTIVMREGWLERSFSENGIDSILFVKIIVMLEDKLDVMLPDDILYMDEYISVAQFIGKIQE